MKTTILYLSCLIVFLSNSSFAQSKFLLGAKAGVSIPNFVSNDANPVVNGYQSILAPTFGLMAEVPLNKQFSFLSEVNYSVIGADKNGDQIIPKNAYKNIFPPGFSFPDYLYSTFYSHLTANYLEIPILLKYNFIVGDKWNFFVNGGIYTGILLNAKGESEGLAFVYTNAERTKLLFPAKLGLTQNQDITERLKPLNIGIQSAVGITYKGLYGNGFAQIGSNFGFVNVQQDAADGANKTRTLSLSVGYLFNISK